jgi:uncharacterized protein (TIGR03000 family)
LVVPFLGVVANTACYAGGVTTGASSARNRATAASPAYFPGFGSFAVSPAPVLGSANFAPAPSALGGAEEQEEPVNGPTPAKLDVRVPTTAELWFEGDRTSQTGALRNFVSPELQPGKSFTYTIRAHWTSPNGQVVDETRQVKVQAGRRTIVDFLNP